MTSNNWCQHIDTKKYKSILCLDGNLPSVEFFSRSGIPIVAADGATNKLYDLGILPIIVVGDCDSVNQEILEKTTYKYVAEQNSTDFQKALEYIDEMNLFPTIICGISGGYLDHIVNNINIFISHPENIFVDDDIIGYCLTHNHEFELPLGSKISIIGLPSCKITTQGLKWELTEDILNFPGNTSCFNRSKSTKIKINILSGTALLIVYRNKINDAGCY